MGQEIHLVVIVIAGPSLVFCVLGRLETIQKLAPYDVILIFNMQKQQILNLMYKNLRENAPL